MGSSDVLFYVINEVKPVGSLIDEPPGENGVTLHDLSEIVRKINAGVRRRVVKSVGGVVDSDVFSKVKSGDDGEVCG